MKVGIAGLGTIGKVVAAKLDAGIEGLELTAVTSRDRAKAEQNLAALSKPVPVVSAEELAARCDVIAEGIETKTQLERLRQLKCPQGQGTLLGQPLSADAAGGLLVKGPRR